MHGMPDRTPSHRLADALLPVPLADYVRDRRNRDPRWSWGLIAEHIAIDTDGAVILSREALRRWFADEFPDRESMAS
jgi:hypothetical protein